jgi:hypothetical protein
MTIILNLPTLNQIKIRRIKIFNVFLLARCRNKFLAASARTPNCERTKASKRSAPLSTHSRHPSYLSKSVSFESDSGLCSFALFVLEQKFCSIWGGAFLVFNYSKKIESYPPSTSRLCVSVYSFLSNKSQCHMKLKMVTNTKENCL